MMEECEIGIGVLTREHHECRGNITLKCPTCPENIICNCIKVIFPVLQKLVRSDKKGQIETDGNAQERYCG
jgi:hypothetical protein